MRALSQNFKPSKNKRIKLDSPRSASEKKIKELEELVETISRGKYMWESTFDAITSPVMIVSSDYVIERANLAAAKAANMDVRQMVGTTCYEKLAGFSEPCHGCPLEKTLKAKESFFHTLEPFAKSGRQYEVNVYPLKSMDKSRQAVLHYHDITEEKKLQRQLLQSEKMAAIGMLAGGVAHEINNPLGGILAFAQLAMRDLASDHATQKDLKEIEEAALRCKRIVQDLLDFSRQNKEEVFGPVQLNDVIKKVMPLIQVQARTSQIDVETHLTSPLQAICGNFHKLQQVILNLVTNAYQAMKSKGGGRLTLKTYSPKNEKKVYAEVSDTGPGIAEGHLEKIFDPYFTTKNQGEGTGLGLSISYGIVQEHGGQIDVKSTFKKGTTFVLSFPIMEE